MKKSSSISDISKQLNKRREHLGISQIRLAEMSGISLPTIQRFFTDNSSNISIETVYKIAEILGLHLAAREVMDEQTIIEKQAREKAHKLASMVQSTSSLEGQGMTRSSYKEIEQRMFHTLMAGSRRKLWGA